MSKRSKVHPKYKTKYRVANWPEHDRALVRRGDLTLWFTPSAIRSWTPLPTGQRGAQPWQSVEGLLGTLLRLVRLDVPIPDHATLSRRTRGLDVLLLRPLTRGPVQLVVDVRSGVVVSVWRLGNITKPGRRTPSTGTNVGSVVG